LWIGPRAPVPGIDESMYDQYIRDPEGLFEDRLAAEFIPGVDVPEDAAYTGYSTSRLKLWIVPNVTSAVFIETEEDHFEQWPRSRVRSRSCAHSDGDGYRVDAWPWSLRPYERGGP